MRTTREPGGSPGAEAIRRLLLEGEGERWDAVSEALLLVAARRDHVARVISPSLRQGVWVRVRPFRRLRRSPIKGYGKGVPLDQLQALHRFALGDFAPDLTLILDVPVELGLARAAARSSRRPVRAPRPRIPRKACGKGSARSPPKTPPAACLIDATGDPQAVHRAVLANDRKHSGLAVCPAPCPLPACGEREGPASAGG